MKVAVGATALLSPLTGIGHYVLQLGRELARDPTLDLHFFYGRMFEADVRLPGGVFAGPWRTHVRRFVPYAYSIRRALEQHAFDAGCSRERFDLYHEPSIVPLQFSGPSVVTVHDLSWVRYPQTHPPERVRSLNRYFQRGIEKAALVLTDSVFVRDELAAIFGVDGARVRVVPLGADAEFHPRTVLDTRRVTDQMDLQHGRYFLAVGTLEPRKNLETVLTAYSSLSPALRARFPLVIAGMPGWQDRASSRQLGRLVATGEVRLTGYLQREDLACLMAGALALVFPSLYEGFGLPPLEAMASAVPVITSNVASIPEVVGDAGLMVAPLDVDALAAAMAQVAADPALRNHLASRGQQRAREFSWSRCAVQTADAYRLVASTSR